MGGMDARILGETLAPQHAAEELFANQSSAELDLLRKRTKQLAVEADDDAVADLAPVALLVLGEEHYAVELDAVREFSPLRQYSPVPCCPDHIIGQMNLRGNIVTLLDIKALLQVSSRNSPGANDVVVIVQHQDAPVGLVVDEVLDVQYIDRQQRETIAPADAAASKYFAGSLLHEQRLIYLLDLPRILNEAGLVVEETV
jgi:purine-binding chemotaxis protein CheW